jgi:hypothetical protein
MLFFLTLFVCSLLPAFHWCSSFRAFNTVTLTLIWWYQRHLTTPYMNDCFRASTSRISRPPSCTWITSLTWSPWTTRWTSQMFTRKWNTATSKATLGASLEAGWPGTDVMIF